MSQQVEKIFKESQKCRNSVWFILSNVFLERFSSGGVLAILALYLNQKLHFASHSSTTIFHANELVLYFSSIVGAVMADTWLGLFKTITFMSFLMSVGSAVIAVTSIDLLHLPMKFCSLLGLLVIVFASGGLRSNQNVFGGNQFSLPDQQKQLNSYFNLQFFVLKSGLLLGQILVPVLRHDLRCFGMENCYPLAFGVPAALMLISFVILLCGKASYVQVSPTGSMLIKVCRCIWKANRNRLICKKSARKLHWLDYAEDPCGHELVADTKKVLNVLTVFSSLPVYWALNMQTNSRWVFTASRLNGNIGWYTIKPDQMVMTTTFFIIALIPVFERLVFPTIARIGIKSNPQKVITGFCCAIVAHLISALVEWKASSDVSILWLLPQYFMIAASEVLIWVPVLSLGFTEAPTSMKSVITACLYLTSGGGSLIVVLVSSFINLQSEVHENLLYVLLMAINVLVFCFIKRK